MSYYLITDDVNDIHVYDGLYTDGDSLLDISDSFVSYEEVHINKEEFVVGYFYYNDETDYRSASEMEFNTLDHLDLYEQTHCGGHYILDSYQLVKDGKVVDYKVVSDRFEYNDDGMTYITDTNSYFKLGQLPCDGNFDECLERMKEYDKTLKP